VKTAVWWDVAPYDLVGTVLMFQRSLLPLSRGYYGLMMDVVNISETSVYIYETTYIPDGCLLQLKTELCHK